MGIQKGTGENQSVGRHLFIPLQTEEEVCFSRLPQIECLFPLRLSIIQFFLSRLLNVLSHNQTEKKKKELESTLLTSSPLIPSRVENKSNVFTRPSPISVQPPLVFSNLFNSSRSLSESSHSSKQILILSLVVYCSKATWVPSHEIEKALMKSLTKSLV